MEKVDASREEALKILVKIFEEKSYSNILIKNLGQRFTLLDRAFITEIVYGTVKYKQRLDYIIDNMSNIKLGKISPSVMNILRMGLYQIEFLDRVPQSAAVDESVKLAKKYENLGASKFVNGLLRSYCRKRKEIKYPDRDKNIVDYISIYYSYPKWLVKKVISEYGNKFAEEFFKAGNDVPDLTVRVNSLKTDRETLKKRLEEKNIDVRYGIYMEDALILKNVPGIGHMDEFKEGLFTVQDESSMLASYILSPAPGDMVIDVCSAPGTKSTYFGELMENKGSIISGDISKSKLKLVEENSKRLGINIITAVYNDATKIMDEYKDMADKVIVDAPCSGLGIMRKKPEIRWNRAIEDIKSVSKIQEDILNASSRYVKIGGELVYSTCTILKEENIEVVSRFLENNKNFEPVDLSADLPEKLAKPSGKQGFIELYPNIDLIDGFFIAKMRRVA